jgi:TadE-like protein
MQPIQRVIQTLRRYAPERRGAVSVEFALAMTVLLLPLVVGVIDLGKGLWVRMQVGNSARAGAEFATACQCADTLKIGNTVTQTIVNAEQGAAGLGTTVGVHSAYFCGCSSATPLTITFADGTATTLDGINLAPSASQPITDPVATVQLPACAPAGSFCPDGVTRPGAYVTVTAKARYTPLISYPGIVPASGYFDLLGAATSRIH